MPNAISLPPQVVTGSAAGRRTLQRRRVLLAALLIAAVLSLLVAFVARQGPMWGVQLATDTLLLAYVVALIHLRNAAAEQEMTRRVLTGS